ncbi:MAG: HEAT repeat domain-containing protein [Planctomycetia bacterium]|nr:HEAT repeat domain-containing protein [Planctomycetia bacterium]
MRPKNTLTKPPAPKAAAPAAVAASPAPRSSIRLPAWSTVPALAACLLLAANYLAGRSQSWVAGQWQNELAAARGTEAEVVLNRLASLGEPGLPPLVAALADDRPDVSLAAHRVLRDEIDRWAALDRPAASRRLLALAEALAANGAKLHASAPRAAVDLAQKILEQPIDADAVDPIRLAAACQQVLDFPIAGTAARPAQPTSQGSRGGNGNTGASAAAPSSAPSEVNLRPVPIDGDGRGGAATVGIDPTTPDQPPDAGQPKLNAAGADSVVPNQPAELKGAGPSEANPLRAQSADGDKPSPPAASGAPRTPPLSASPAQRHPALVKLSDRELLDALRRSPRELAATVLDEFRARGWAWERIELAQGVTDADPKVRLRWAAALPQLQGVDTSWWLLRLAADENADVRWQALSALATSNDPAVLRQVHEQAHGDPDARIRDLSRRISDRIRR